ncbi:MAG: acetylxylan esterase [Verrucomicrobia bacterium]|nr:acetylxylan esterase [Verrucomicrobiota bacterium]
MITPRKIFCALAASLFTLAATRPALAADSKAPGIAASPVLKPATAGSVPAGPEGFLTRWLVLDPIPGDGRVTDSAIRAAATKEYFANQNSVMPRDGDKVTIAGYSLFSRDGNEVKVATADYTWHAVDCSRHNLNLYHLAFFQGKPTSNVVFWGVTVVNSPDEISGVRLAVGSNAGSVWWVNGQEVTAVYGDKQTTIDDSVSRKLTLKKGANIVRFLVVQNAGMVDCCARFLDANDQPLSRLTFTLTDPAAK